MKLSKEQLFSCARGAVYATQEGDVVRLHRFTPEQEEFYRNYNEEHYARSFATAGIVLEFDTNSESLSLAVTCRKGSSRHWFVHSIFVNGERIGELRGKYAEKEIAEAEESWSLGTGNKRVKIIFPWSSGSYIRALELHDGAAFVAVKPAKTALIYGDSITHGYDAKQPENSYASILAEHLGMNCINKAIGGAVFRPDMAVLKDDLQPSVITVAYGTNDWSGVNNEKLEANAAGFFAALRANYPHTPIVMLAPVWRGDWQRERPAVAFRQIPEIFAKIAAQVGNAYVVDCFDFIPHDPANYSPDVLHPNDDGFAHYAKCVIEAVDKILK